MINSTYTEALGLLAATLTTTAFVPQVYRTWKTKNADSLSMMMLSIFFAGVMCWLVYGLLVDSLPIILANAVTGFLGFLLIIFKIRY